MSKNKILYGFIVPVSLILYPSYWSLLTKMNLPTRSLAVIKLDEMCAGNDDPLAVFDAYSKMKPKEQAEISKYELAMALYTSQLVAAEMAELAPGTERIDVSNEGLFTWHAAQTIQARVRGMIARQRVLAAKTKAQTSFYRSAVDVSAKSSVRHGVPADRPAGARAYA